MIEIWKAIPGFEFYEASNCGRIRSLTRTVTMRNGVSRSKKGQILKPKRQSAGYHMYTLSGKQNKTAHELIALAFIGPRPEGYYVCHKDGNKTNNRADNLYYGTPTDNMADAVNHGTVERGERRYNSKLTEAKVKEMRLLRGKISYSEMAEKFGVTTMVAYRAANKRSWKHV